MKVLLTGATGFIGNYVSQELLKRKINVVATSILPASQIRSSWLKEVEYIQANLNEKREDWFYFFGEPDILIHLAWSGLPNYEELFHFEENLPNSYSFIKNMVVNGLKKVLVTGTCLEYGMQSGQLKETMDAKPNTPYALAKDCLRKFLEQLQIKTVFDLQWVRLFYIYGRGQRPDAVLAQLEAALQRKDGVFNMSGGEQLRDYLPVEKVAEYLVKIALQDKISGIINCCSGKPVTIKDLVRNYLADTNRTIELNLGYYSYPDYEPMAFWGDNTKLKQIIKDS